MTEPEHRSRPSPFAYAARIGAHPIAEPTPLHLPDPKLFIDGALAGLRTPGAGRLSLPDEVVVLNGGGTIPQQSLARVMRNNVAAGERPRILYSTWGTSVPDEHMADFAVVAERYKADLMEVPRRETMSLHKAQLEFESRLAWATVLILAGGDQLNYRTVFQAAPSAYQAILTAIEERRIAVVTSSAGTAVATGWSIYRPNDPGSPPDAFFVEPGIGIFRHFIVEQHLDREGRLERLKSAMLEAGVSRGVGIDTHTCLQVHRNQGWGLVAGSGRVVLVHYDAHLRPAFHETVLGAGARVNLMTWECAA